MKLSKEFVVDKDTCLYNTNIPPYSIITNMIVIETYEPVIMTTNSKYIYNKNMITRFGLNKMKTVKILCSVHFLHCLKFSGKCKIMFNYFTYSNKDLESYKNYLAEKQFNKSYIKNTANYMKFSEHVDNLNWCEYYLYTKEYYLSLLGVLGEFDKYDLEVMFMEDDDYYL